VLVCWQVGGHVYTVIFTYACMRVSKYASVNVLYVCVHVQVCIRQTYIHISIYMFKFMCIHIYACASHLYVDKYYEK